MEILSTGEKIKRARIYKGATLKDICEDKISVSKMSCIENDKIKPESWILEFIAEKLDLDIDYLMKDVREQISYNVESLEKEKFSKAVEEKLQYNFEYAIQYKYYDLAFNIMHDLFGGYLELSKFENIQIITSKYYDLCQKSNTQYNQLTYYKDMAKYLYMNEEYVQASTYYNTVRKVLRESNSEDWDMLSSVIFNETACHMMLENYDRAYEIGVRLVDLLGYIEDNIKKAEIYHLLAILSIKMKKDNFKEYEAKSYEYYKDNNAMKAKAILNYASAIFEERNYNDKAVEYLKKGLDTYPDTDKEGFVDYMISCIDELIKANELKEAQEICDEALNNAISCDNIKFIERTYYFKSIILQKQNKYEQAEMYMNLSLDALFKFGNKKERYERYLQMANMYYKIGEVREALKYFSLAIGTEKNI